MKRICRRRSSSSCLAYPPYNTRWRGRRQEFSGLAKETHQQGFSIHKPTTVVARTTYMACCMKDKADVAFQFYDNLMGTPATQTNSIALEELGLPRLQLDELGNRFTKEEVWKVIRSLPLDKASGPDSFTVRFLQSTWKIIRLDLMRVLDAFWHRDMRSFHSLNQALMVLLPKYSETQRNFSLLAN
jgi:hypothetical protein